MMRNSNSSEDNILYEYCEVQESNNYISNMIQGFNSSVSEMNISPYIECKAGSCIYNFSGECTARKVMVYGESNGVQGTLCDTFIEK